MKFLILIILLFNPGYLHSQVIANIHSPFRSNSLTTFEDSKYHDLFTYKPFHKEALSKSMETNPKTSLWAEVGYVVAMETVFGGLSYYASHGNRTGAKVTGSVDLMIGTAGLGTLFSNESRLLKIGYLTISTGFFWKSYYNFRLSKSRNAADKFWTNFAGFNLLVFTGYYLDTLKRNN